MGNEATEEILLIFPCLDVCADGIRMLLKHFYLVILSPYTSMKKDEEWRDEMTRNKQTIHLITSAIYNDNDVVSTCQKILNAPALDCF